MATRGQIGIQYKDGSITSVYSHYDNYITDGNGEILYNNYNNIAKANNLISLGNISSLGKNIESTKFYDRDMNRKGEEAGKFRNFDDWQKNSSYGYVDYNYLYDAADGEWYVWGSYDDRLQGRPLSFALAEKLAKGGKIINNKHMSEHEHFNRGGRQGYNDRLDESLAMRRGKKRQNFKDRRDESKGNERSRLRRAYSSVGTMDRFNSPYRLARGGNSHNDSMSMLRKYDVRSPYGTYSKGGRPKKGGKAERNIYLDMDIVEDVLSGSDTRAHSELIKMLDRNNVKMEVLTWDGPAGGHPLVSLYGTRNNIKKALKANEGWGLDETDAKWELELGSYYHAKGGKLMDADTEFEYKRGGKTGWNWTEKEVRKGANTLAEALTINDMIINGIQKGVTFKVHDFEYDKGKGAGFEISMDGEKHMGGSYYVKADGTMVNADATDPYGGGGDYGQLKDSIEKIMRDVLSFQIDSEYAKGGKLPKELEEAIKEFEDRIKKQGRITNARDEEHLERLKKLRSQYAKGGDVHTGSRLNKAGDSNFTFSGDNKKGVYTGRDISMMAARGKSLKKRKSQRAQGGDVFTGKDVSMMAAKGKLVPSLHPTHKEVLQLMSLPEVEAQQYIIGQKDLVIGKLKDKMQDIHEFAELALQGDDFALEQIESISDHARFNQGGEAYTGSKLADAGNTDFSFTGKSGSNETYTGKDVNMMAARGKSLKKVKKASKGGETGIGMF